MSRPIATGQLTFRSAICLVVAGAGFGFGLFLLWPLLSLQWPGGWPALAGVTLVSTCAAWLYVDFLEPLFFRLPGRRAE